MKEKCANDNIFLVKCNFLFTKMNFLKVNFSNLQFIKYINDTFANVFLITLFCYFQTIQKFI